jgi:cell division protein FtsW
VKFAVTTLVGCVAALLSLGLVMLYSSSMAQVGPHYLKVQLLWCALGLGLCIISASLDYHLLRRFAWPLLIVAVVLLALVFVPHFGIRRNGANRWLGYGSWSLQPSEFAKLALIIVLAWYGERFQRQMGTWKRGVLLPGIFIAVVLGLIFREPDRGTTILLASVSGTMLLIAGVRWRFILPPVLAALVGLGFSLWHDPMRTKRIFGWLYLEEHKAGVGYQAYQAMLGLGAGGLTGLGLGNGRQKLGFLPEHHTDFIFSVIGEELGLVATLLVIVGFITIVICGICIAFRAPDTFGLLLGSGVAFLIGLQAFINIGVVTSALPNKGLPLPFISYGGSNLLIMLSSVGILLSIARQARPPGILGDQRRADESTGLRAGRNPFKNPKAEIRIPRQTRAVDRNGRSAFGLPPKLSVCVLEHAYPKGLKLAV